MECDVRNVQCVLHTPICHGPCWHCRHRLRSHSHLPSAFSHQHPEVPIQAPATTLHWSSWPPPVPGLQIEASRIRSAARRYCVYVVQATCTAPSYPCNPLLSLQHNQIANRIPSPSGIPQVHTHLDHRCLPHMCTGILIPMCQVHKCLRWVTWHPPQWLQPHHNDKILPHHPSTSNAGTTP